MRHRSTIVALVLTTLLGVAACGERQPAPTEVSGIQGLTPGSATLVVDGGTVALLADQDLDVGDVTVSDSRNELTVDIAMEGGWCLGALQIDAGETKVEIPRNGAGNPIPGHFQVNETLECAAGATRTLPLPDGAEIVVAVHVVVLKGDREESAWADGNLFVDTGNWATFVAFDANDPPAATIIAPSDGATFTEGEAITLESTAADEEDGTLTGSALEWSSDVDGALGTGGAVTTSSLSVGTHTITLTATDSEGATDTDQISITLEEATATGTVLAYLVNRFDDDVSVIDVGTNAATTTISLVTSPADMAIRPQGDTAYVALPSYNSLSVIDLTTNRVTTPYFAAGTSPRSIAFTPDGGTAYVTNEDGHVSVIDVATQSLTDQINVGVVPNRIAITPDGSTALVSDRRWDDLSVIDLATRSITTITIGRSGDLAITPDGSTAYVLGSVSETVSVIDLATNTRKTTIDLAGNLPVGTVEGSARIAITPDGTTAYVTNFGSDNVSLIDVATNTRKTTRIQVGTEPLGVAFTPDGATAYVTNSGSDDVSVIDVATNTVTTTIAVGDGPGAIGFTP